MKYHPLVATAALKEIKGLTNVAAGLVEIDLWFLLFISAGTCPLI
jgi:hypothetical protein